MFKGIDKDEVGNVKCVKKGGVPEIQRAVKNRVTTWRELQF